MRRTSKLLAALALTVPATPKVGTRPHPASNYDLNTLAGKVAALRGTAGLQIRFSSFIENEAQDGSAAPTADPITPTYVLSSPLDGSSVLPPDVTANQDTAAALTISPAGFWATDARLAEPRCTAFRLTTPSGSISTAP